jgi:hypothetical protein
MNHVVGGFACTAWVLLRLTPRRKRPINRLPRGPAAQKDLVDLTPLLIS